MKKYLPFHIGVIGLFFNCRTSQEQGKSILTGNDCVQGNSPMITESPRPGQRRFDCSQRSHSKAEATASTGKRNTLALPIHLSAEQCRGKLTRHQSVSVTSFRNLRETTGLQNSSNKLRKLQFVERSLLFSCLTRDEALVFYDNM